MHKKEEKHTGIKGDKTILYSCMLINGHFTTV